MPSRSGSFTAPHETDAEIIIEKWQMGPEKAIPDDLRPRRRRSTLRAAETKELAMLAQRQPDRKKAIEALRAVVARRIASAGGGESISKNDIANAADTFPTMSEKQDRSATKMTDGEARPSNGVGDGARSAKNVARPTETWLKGSSSNMSVGAKDSELDRGPGGDGIAAQPGASKSNEKRAKKGERKGTDRSLSAFNIPAHLIGTPIIRDSIRARKRKQQEEAEAADPEGPPGKRKPSDGKKAKTPYRNPHVRKLYKIDACDRPPFSGNRIDPDTEVVQKNMLPASGRVKGCRYVYRVMEALGEFEDWKTFERGAPTSAKGYPLRYAEMRQVFSDIDELFGMRHVIESSDLGAIAEMDRLEENFIREIVHAQARYGDGIERLGLLPERMVKHEKDGEADVADDVNRAEDET